MCLMDDIRSARLTQKTTRPEPHREIVIRVAETRHVEEWPEELSDVGVDCDLHSLPRGHPDRRETDAVARVGTGRMDKPGTVHAPGTRRAPQNYAFIGGRKTKLRGYRLFEGS